MTYNRLFIILLFHLVVHLRRGITRIYLHSRYRIRLLASTDTLHGRHLLQWPRVPIWTQGQRIRQDEMQGEL